MEMSSSSSNNKNKNNNNYKRDNYYQQRDNHHNDNNSHQTQHQQENAAPIYITVGPQCIGKTTFLKSKKPNAVDISLDDQPGIYLPVPLDWFLGKNITDKAHQEHFGKTLKQRILQDNKELVLLLQRWSNNISPELFATYMTQLYPQQLQQREEPQQQQQQQRHPNNNTASASNYSSSNSIQEAQDYIQIEDYIQIVEEFIQTSQLPVPTTIQLFCAQALHTKDGNGESSITKANNEFRRLATTQPETTLAWGNTNLQPRDYRLILDIAHETNRPVVFLSTANQELPLCSLSTLLKRNLNRLAASGKYIPHDTITRFNQMNTELTTKVLEKSQKYNITIDQALVQEVSTRFTLYTMDRKTCCIIKKHKQQQRQPPTTRGATFTRRTTTKSGNTRYAASTTTSYGSSTSSCAPLLHSSAEPSNRFTRSYAEMAQPAENRFGGSTSMMATISGNHAPRIVSEDPKYDNDDNNRYPKRARHSNDRNNNTYIPREKH